MMTFIDDLVLSGSVAPTRLTGPVVDGPTCARFAREAFGLTA
ncbi:hypothetical protein QQX10_03420 [Demequina sp. SYSU T00039]|uniref:Uncharacterized protein n=1 Tax=Demequina lignilytica TaxID=3051663 RepID=A0AAW7M8B7_9MICO|nr:MULTISPECIES: hypothetical protein [unclassified Demequina]MDN4477038.1 hypothetical protein [Demequina sp. SYSU T00039-1]MDN4487211.1 hypothetical protein [Demequina sp. SYSU T00039]MDN4491794.1 hypothetical protein [Demequina sp. SYSU T00068]